MPKVLQGWQRRLARPKQGTPCPICGRANRLLVWDHDHKTEEFRGWVCSPCNLGLGMFGDKPAVLLHAIEYLLGQKLSLTGRPGSDA